MSQRITIVLDDDLQKKLHEMQAKKIKETAKAASFSSIVNEVVRTSLKK